MTAKKRANHGRGLLAVSLEVLGRWARWSDRSREPVATTPQSWRDYLDLEPRELPIARPTFALAVHALRDEMVLLGLRARRPVSDVHEFDRINREMVAALEFCRRGWQDKPEGFFAGH